MKNKSEIKIDLKPEFKNSGATQVLKKEQKKPALRVKSDFGNFKKGDLIMEEKEIDKVLKGPFKTSVDKINLG